MRTRQFLLGMEGGGGAVGSACGGSLKLASVAAKRSRISVTCAGGESPASGGRVASVSTRCRNNASANAVSDGSHGGGADVGATESKSANCRYVFPGALVRHTSPADK